MTGALHRLFVLRHGESPSHDIYWGTTTVGLSERGRETARRVASTMRGVGVARLLHSPQRRAAQTAAVIARELEAPIAVGPDSRLAAKDYGEFNGQPKRSVVPFRTRYTTDREMLLWAPERGESYWAVFGRMLAFLQEAAHSAGGATVAVTHEGVVKVVMCLSERSLAPLRGRFAYGQLVDVTPLLGRLSETIEWLLEIQESERLPTMVGSASEPCKEDKTWRADGFSLSVADIHSSRW